MSAGICRLEAKFGAEPVVANLDCNGLGVRIRDRHFDLDFRSAMRRPVVVSAGRSAIKAFDTGDGEMGLTVTGHGEGRGGRDGDAGQFFSPG